MFLDLSPGRYKPIPQGALCWHSTVSQKGPWRYSYITQKAPLFYFRKTDRQLFLWPISYKTHFISSGLSIHVQPHEKKTFLCKVPIKIAFNKFVCELWFIQFAMHNAMCNILFTICFMQFDCFIIICFNLAQCGSLV